MDWNQLYGKTTEPGQDEIIRFIGKAAPLWEDLKAYLETAYHTAPKMSYSSCSAQPGWNVKYQKSGKSLCTLYPMEDYFIALVVIGTKEEAETEAAMTLGVFSEQVQEQYGRTAFSCGGRWLMISVKDKAVLEDVKRLIGFRVKPKA